MKNNCIIKRGSADLLGYGIYSDRVAMGSAAAADAAAHIKKLLNQKDQINIIFAAAPSQNEFLAGLSASDVDFSRINAFHMDEYIGLSPDAPQGFGNFLKRAIFSKKNFKSVNLINCAATDPDAECKRYASLIKDLCIDIVCMGIGENGHIAFNDPGTKMADFNDPLAVKVVTLDEICRRQQVNDGCFASLSEVPKFAITLTVPTLFSGERIFCVVPAATKAEAVKSTVTGAVVESCPASVLRKHKNAFLYCDIDSGKYLV